MGGQRLLNPQGRFFRNQDVGLEAETRSRESPERWRRGEGVSQDLALFLLEEKKIRNKEFQPQMGFLTPSASFLLQISNIWRIRSR